MDRSSDLDPALGLIVCALLGLACWAVGAVAVFVAPDVLSVFTANR